MAKTLPVIPTPIHDEETALNASATELLKKKIVQNINFYGLLPQIGMIEIIQINQIGVDAPDTGVWQLCDGSEITNPFSPLRTIGLVTRFTPNYSDRNIRFANTLIDNNQGGTQSHSLAHSQTGVTTIAEFPVKTGDAGDERLVHKLHDHSIPEAFPGTTVIENPASYFVAPYMKIA